LNDEHRSGGVPVAIEIAITRKSFRSASGFGNDVLADIAFRLETGTITAITAPSGAGKTTLLKIIAGLDRDFDGRLVSSARRVGFVFQEPRLIPWRSVFDNLRIAAPATPTSELDALLGTFHLEQHRHHYPHELSLGLARRVAIARAFVVHPDLLLLDEPFVSLDERLVNELRQELIALVEANRITTLLATHDIAEAVRIAERMIVLDGHPTRVVADHPLREPRNERSDTFVSRAADAIRSRRRLV